MNEPSYQRSRFGQRQGAGVNRRRTRRSGTVHRVIDFRHRISRFRFLQLNFDRRQERLAGLQKSHARLHAGNRLVVSGPWGRNEHIPKRFHHLCFFVGD